MQHPEDTTDHHPWQRVYGSQEKESLQNSFQLQPETNEAKRSFTPITSALLAK
ncbi:hypothetical protein L798_13058 [Zootermopsis nevadensis]|uniref:Uncharacterized protein n=1 Tax=Zootermopsis nevadensis TaxID=136037 RepID=A0A067QSU5_ZOONE|nr:hypothetical protein L798_13058 [Zootermopsis nevadensis]